MMSLIVCILLLVYLFIVYSSYGQDIRNPNILFAFYWVGAIIFGLIGSHLFNLYYFFSAVIVIVLHVLSFNFGGMLVYYSSKNKFSAVNEYYLNNTKVRRIVLGFSFLSFLSIFFLIGSLGFSLSTLFDFASFFEIANTASVSRYDQRLNLPASYKILSIFSYSAVFFAAILYSNSDKKGDKVISFLPIGSALLNAMVNGSRAGLLMSILLFLATLLGMTLVNNKKVPLFTVLKNLIILVLIFIGIFLLIQMLRGGNKDVDITTFGGKLVTYMFGSFNAFGIWWETHDSVEYGLGKYTFAGIHDILFGGREQGLFNEPVFISQTEFSNVYTIFRSTIEDFGLAGSLLFFFIYGTLTMKAYHNLFASPKYFVLFVLMVFVVLWSVIVNPLIYNTILVSFLVNLGLMRYILNKSSL